MTDIASGPRLLSRDLLSKATMANGLDGIAMLCNWWNDGSAQDSPRADHFYIYVCGHYGHWTLLDSLSDSPVGPDNITIDELILSTTVARCENILLRFCQTSIGLYGSGLISRDLTGKLVEWHHDELRRIDLFQFSASSALRRVPDGPWPIRSMSPDAIDLVEQILLWETGQSQITTPVERALERRQDKETTAPDISDTPFTLEWRRKNRETLRTDYILANSSIDDEGYGNFDTLARLVHPQFVAVLVDVSIAIPNSLLHVYISALTACLVVLRWFDEPLGIEVDDIMQHATAWLLDQHSYTPVPVARPRQQARA